MSNDLYKTVNYNDGEGLTHTDFNNQTRFLSAQLSDQVLGRLVGGPYNDSGFGELAPAEADFENVWAYCINVCGGLPYQGSANNKIAIWPGTLMQKVAVANGNGSTLLSYTFDDTLEFTIANGHATLNRYDMIQMKLELETGDLQSRDFEDATTHIVTSQSVNKQYRVKATVSLKSGTPAATPAYPTPDTGYVPICCVRVGATYVHANPLKIYDTSGAEAVIHDLRMPIKIEALTVGTRTAQRDSSKWSESVVGIGATTNDNADRIRFLVPLQQCRLISAKAHLDATATPFNKVEFGVHYAGPSTNWIATHDCPDMRAVTTNAVIEEMVIANITANTLPTGTIDETTGYRAPVWGNGGRCYRPAVGGAADLRCCALGFSAINGNGILGHVQFVVARGL